MFLREIHFIKKIFIQHLDVVANSLLQNEPVIHIQYNTF